MDAEQENSWEKIAKACSLAIIIIFSVVGNILIIFTIVRDKTLHRAPFYLVLNLALCDLFRTVICYPFIVSSLFLGGWKFGAKSCRVVAAVNFLLIYETLFILFVIGITRHVVLKHYTFHQQKLRLAACSVVSGITWLLASIITMPPIFGVGDYQYASYEHQCTLQYKSNEVYNDTFGSLLSFVVISFLSQCIYLKIFCFLRSHRRMNPGSFVPAVSGNWNFYGPGATGQATANWIAGYTSQGPPPPMLAGFNGQQQNRLAMLHHQSSVKYEGELTKALYIVTSLFLALWLPYLIHHFYFVFNGLHLGPQFVAAAAWFTYLPPGLNPVVYFSCCSELRVSIYRNMLKRQRTLASTDGAATTAAEILDS